MGKTLVIVRHSKAERPELGQSDHARKLNKKGHVRAKGIAEQIRDLRLNIDLALVSDSARTKETIDVFRPILALRDDQIFLKRTLYLTGLDDYLDEIHSCPHTASTVMVVGHNPTVAWLGRNLYPAKEFNWATGSALILNCDISNWTELHKSNCKFVTYFDAKKMA